MRKTIGFRKALSGKFARGRARTEAAGVSRRGEIYAAARGYVRSPRRTFRRTDALHDFMNEGPGP